MVGMAELRRTGGAPVSAWKALELRVAKALGGSRTGPAGKAVSDIVGTPWAVECKRSKQSFRVAWIEQAVAQGRRERKPWLLVVARHNDRNPICVMEFSEFLTLAREAGRIDDQTQEEAA